MPCQLPADCLNEIFEYLENDELRSCLLVNHLWCEVSVRILWRSICNYNTLISCLPKESKEILYKNKIITSTTISKPPLFDYVKFIKYLSTYNVNSIIKNILKSYKSVTPQCLDYTKRIVAQEVYKLLMAQIYSLRRLNFNSYLNIPGIYFTSYPGAKNCLKNLTKLSCSSDIYPEFFYQLSQICHNIQQLNITFRKVISNGLAYLISVQQKLKYLDIIQDYEYENENLTTIISSLTKLPKTLIKLGILGYCLPLSFIAKFTNLQELELSFNDHHAYYSFKNLFKDFSRLQYVTFSQLQILKFNYTLPKTKFLIKFLETNGRSLKEFILENLNDSSSLNSLNLSIAEFCPNLKILSTLIWDDELNTLEEIFNNCQYLESVKVWCVNRPYLNEKELLEVVAEHSPENFCKLKLCYLDVVPSELLPEELESIFKSWMNRIPLKPLSCIFDNVLIEKFDKNMEVIGKYRKLGIIKKFQFNIW